jgi:hypothetical protein
MLPKTEAWHPAIQSAHVVSLPLPPPRPKLHGFLLLPARKVILLYAHVHSGVR